jgi:hypothetical protein
MTKELDITTEASRTYTYAGGETFTIEAPATLHIIEDEKGTTHRVVDANGTTHRPERGWVGISWTAKEGAPKFVA